MPGDWRVKGLAGNLFADLQEAAGTLPGPPTHAQFGTLPWKVKTFGQSPAHSIAAIRLASGDRRGGGRPLMCDPGRDLLS